MTSYAIERITNPEKHYDEAPAVLRDERLTSGEKSQVLESMALNARLQMAAAAEGMAPDAEADGGEKLKAAVQAKEKRAVTHPDGLFERVLAMLTGKPDLDSAIVRAACGLAKVTSGNVHLLNVILPDECAMSTSAVSPIGGPQIAALVDQDVLERARAARQEANDAFARQFGPELIGERTVAFGDAPAEVTKRAGELGVDLIVIGAPDRGWFEKLLGPATTQELADAAPCPVLVIPQHD